MSWIRCRCGERISDNSDFLSYKGRIISDREFYGIHEMVEGLIMSDEPDRRKLALTFYDNIGEDKGYHIEVRLIFQCPECGRIYIGDGDGTYCCFLPEGHDEKALLDFKGSDEIVYPDYDNYPPDRAK